MRRNIVLVPLLVLSACFNIGNATDIEFLHDSNEGFIDAHVQPMKGDGRDEAIRSVFEEIRLAYDSEVDLEKGASVEGSDDDHPILSSRNDAVDIKMNMLWDYNHVLELKLGDATDSVKVVPTVMHEDMVLLHKDCRGCWSMHGTRWRPDDHRSLTGETLVSQRMDFIYMMHLYDATLEGRYWQLNVCLDSDKPVCTTDFVVYAVEKASPWFNVLGDGYIGLAPFKGGNTLPDSVHNNILEQMSHKRMIANKIFGVHTHMYNSTEDPSQIRFGGYNDKLVRKNHELRWFKTVSSKSWGLEIVSGGLHSNLVNRENGGVTHAIIEPGYPYIAMPKKDFVRFVNDMNAAYPKEPLTCDHSDWCYFFNPCEEVKKSIPDLMFKIKDKNGETVELRIPPKSFLYSDTDYKTKLKICHVGIIGAKFNDMQFWVLGQALMENFYTIYDAQDENELKIGLAVPVVPDDTKDVVKLAAFIAIGLLSFVFVCILLVVCYKRRQEARVAKARSQFDT